jgi:hypothetical protein
MTKKPPTEPTKNAALRAQIAERVHQLDLLDQRISVAIQQAAGVMASLKPGCRISLCALDGGRVVWGKTNGAWQFVWIPESGVEVPLLSAPRHVRLAFAPKLDEDFLLTRTLAALDEEIKAREEVVK